MAQRAGTRMLRKRKTASKSTRWNGKFMPREPKKAENCPDAADEDRVGPAEETQALREVSPAHEGQSLRIGDPPPREKSDREEHERTRRLRGSEDLLASEADVDAGRTRGEERERPRDDRDTVQPGNEVAAARIEWQSRADRRGVARSRPAKGEPPRAEAAAAGAPERGDARCGAGHSAKPRHVRFQASMLSQSFGRAEKCTASPACRVKP